MTELLYMEDIESNYLREFEAVVKRSGDDFVVLDKSLFYPEGGGQPSDIGEIRWKNKSSEVVKVEKKGDVLHRLKDEVPEEGTKVKGEIDWKRRYEHMKLHTAQHLFSAAVYDNYQASTVGNQIYTDYSRVDFEPLDLSDEEFEEIELVVDEKIKEGRPVRIYEEKRSALEKKIEGDRVNLDLLPKSIDVLRVVDIDSYDICPCAGTHVRNTEEIGGVRLTEVENKGKNKQRIYYELV
ncbi:MAG: alanyl-tRNA editing protein [Candidatus Thermoplasmatota archaeon]|nr:alanyl-tRNA editing protein [Candidatus Thermoplasmatota archaeon]MBS3789962.1 alanyl-tRNA editing protein [Candidatus Thermoplasmatota archaeon]